MYFIPSTLDLTDTTTFASVISVSCILILGLFFYFRETLSRMKERMKHQVREFIKPIFVKVSGDTVSTVKEGPLQSVWEYLDTYFLSPADPDDGEEEEEEEEESGSDGGEEGMRTNLFGDDDTDDDDDDDDDGGD